MGDRSARQPYRQEPPARPAPSRPQRGRWSDAQAFAALDGAAWDARVRVRQGDEVPARVLPWLRVRELWLHAVALGDTGAGTGCWRRRTAAARHAGGRDAGGGAGQRHHRR